MKRIQIYTSEKYYEVKGDSTTYLYKRLLQEPEFETRLSLEPDHTLARTADIVFCRFEIPVKEQFLRHLIALEEEGDRLFINSPRAKLEDNTKRNLRYFTETGVLPPTMISSSPDELVEFGRSLEGRLIVKPVDLNGGQGIERHNPKELCDDALYALARRVTKNGQEEFVWQQYIEGVETLGDKRINVFLYEPITVLRRLAPENAFICNESAGGILESCEYTERDLEIVEACKPILKEKGMTWAGLDVIGPWLSELNLSSPGLLAETDEINGNTEGLEKAIMLIKEWKAA